jgi:hypothetical protein
MCERTISQLPVVTSKEVLQAKEYLKIRVITKLPNSEQSYKGKVKTHTYIKTNQSTTEKL